jgi:hypothetical protein
LKLGDKEPSMVEAKRCELKLPVELKRTARIHCGGRVLIGSIASRDPVKEKKVPTPVRRSVRIRGMKRKDYKEVSPEPKDYGGATIWMIIARACGRPPEDMIMICIFWEEVLKDNTLKGPNSSATTTAAMMATTAAMTMAETLAMTTHVVANLNHGSIFNTR